MTLQIKRCPRHTRSTWIILHLIISIWENWVDKMPIFFLYKLLQQLNQTNRPALIGNDRLKIISFQSSYTQSRISVVIIICTTNKNAADFISIKVILFVPQVNDSFLNISDISNVMSAKTLSSFHQHDRHTVDRPTEYAAAISIHVSIPLWNIIYNKYINGSYYIVEC